MSKWYSKFIPGSNDSEIKALEAKLDQVTEEFADLEHFTKFYDADPSTSASGGLYELAGIDQVVNTSVLQRLFVTETWVYIAIMAIAETISGLPIKGQKKTKVKKTVLNDLTGNPEVVDQEAWTDATGEKAFKCFSNPNQYTTTAEFFMLLIIDLLSTGNYYIWLDSDVDLTTVVDSTGGDANSPFARLQQLMASDSHIKGMYRIPPQLMKPMPSETGLGVEVYAMESDKGVYAFNPAEIVHVKLPNPMNMYEGLSPLIPAFKPVLLDRFSTEHIIRFYKSGARLGGVIETEKTLNKEQLSRFQRSFDNNYTGRQNHHRTLILPPGMKYNPIEQNPAEIALLEFCKYNRDAILSTYKVPPIMVGVMDHANYANALVQMKMFFEHTIKPILKFVQDGFNCKVSVFPAQQALRMQFDLSEVEALKDNFKDKADAAKAMLEAGLTVDEVRKRVWSEGPIAGGNRAPTVEKMNQLTFSALDKPSEEGSGANDPVTSEKPTDTQNQEASEAQENIQENQITDPTLSLNGAQVSAMMQIVQQVAQGFLPRESGVEMIVAAFSVPRDAAERIMGSVGKTFTVDPNKPIEQATEEEDPTADMGARNDPSKSVDQPDAAAIASDINPTKISFSERVSQLVAELVGKGDPISVAIPKAIAQAIAEGLDPDDDNDPNGGGSSGPNSNGSGAPDGSTPPASEEGKDLDTSAWNPVQIGGKPKKDDEEEEDDKKAGAVTLDQFMRDRLSQMGDVPVSPSVISSLITEFEVASQAPTAPKMYSNGMTKDHIVAHWKSFSEKTEPMILRRAYEVQKFFKQIKSVIMNQLGANVKAYGLHKSRDEDDIEQILKLENFEKELKQYAKEIDNALQEAYQYGYVDTLGTFKFDLSNEVAQKQLSKYAASRVTGILDTTREQLKAVLEQAFAEGVAITEVSQRINEKFAEISSGRAVTIARTETLTAVSMGREEKRQEWKKEFPDRKLMKMWVSSQDEKVRDTHEKYDGTSVEEGEEFAPGLKFPRDPACDDAAEVINCRCTDITYDAEDKELIEQTLPKQSNEEE